MTINKSTKRIFIADDDPNIVQLLHDVLRDEGYEVATATQSLRVYDRIKETYPDLILMDVMMPYLDGFQQLKLLNLDDDLQRIPVIIITAKANAMSEISDPAALRIRGCLYKPFEFQELLTLITSIFEAQPRPK